MPEFCGVQKGERRDTNYTNCHKLGLSPEAGLGDSISVNS
jgi:hypothetical protein